MEEFLESLDNAINAWGELEKYWGKIEATHSDLLSEKYPFDKDFREILHNMLEWKEHLKNSKM